VAAASFPFRRGNNKGRFSTVEINVVRLGNLLLLTRGYIYLREEKLCVFFNLFNNDGT